MVNLQTTTADSRGRGKWRKTWRIFFWLPRYCRPIYAHWQMGGGVDEWEFSEVDTAAEMLCEMCGGEGHLPIFSYAVPQGGLHTLPCPFCREEAVSNE